MIAKKLKLRMFLDYGPLQVFNPQNGKKLVLRILDKLMIQTTMG